MSEYASLSRLAGAVSGALLATLNFSGLAAAQHVSGALTPTETQVEAPGATYFIAGAPMIELSLTACRDDRACRNFSMLYDAYQVSLMTCMIAGQREVAAWSLAHPGWNVARWSCQFHDTRKMDA
jgi:hypothetical protein